jgi:hypothetical protein
LEEMMSQAYLSKQWKGKTLDPSVTSTEEVNYEPLASVLPSGNSSWRESEDVGAKEARSA